MAKSVKTFAEWETTPLCSLCGFNQGLERHHKIFRSQGGKEGDNLILLCKVCHGAAHGLFINFGGHSCSTCPVLSRKGCYFGERVMDMPRVTPQPWELK